MKVKNLYTVFCYLLVITSLILSSVFIVAAQQKNNNSDPEILNPALAKLLTDELEAYSATEVSKSGGEPVTLIHIRKGQMHRVETEQQGIKIISIIRPDLKNSFIIRPDKRVYAETGDNVPLFVYADPFNLRLFARTLAPRNVKIETLGKENQGGYNCDKYRVSFDQANVVQKVTLWKAVDLKGLVIRQELESGGITSSFELQNITFDVSPASFEVPKEYKRVADRAEMFRRPD